MIGDYSHHMGNIARNYLNRDSQRVGQVTQREPSIVRDHNGALIIHSATKRSTGYIPCGAQADAFSASFAACTTTAERNQLVDRTVP
jgi:hypothetical protein